MCTICDSSYEWRDTESEKRRNESFNAEHTFKKNNNNDNININLNLCIKRERQNKGTTTEK